MRAVNIVAIFPRPADDGIYARVKRRLRAAAQACADRSGDVTLARRCRGRDGGVPPAGEGTDADELAPVGSSVRVGDIPDRTESAMVQLDV